MGWLHLVGRRRLLQIIALAWIAVGLVGVYRYVNNYNDTRGFPRLERTAGVPPGHLEWMHFYSPALGREAGYVVYLPSVYTPARRYPVLYLLHGMPGFPQAFVKFANIDVRMDDLVQAHRMPPMILVFPDGRINGTANSDSEWANTPSGNFESYVLEVVRNVDAQFATIAARGERVIAGYSAGGFGALNIAFHHPDRFGAVEAWSGPFVETPTGVFAHASSAAIAYYSPLSYARLLRPEIVKYPLRVFVYGGRADPDSRDIPPLLGELTRDGADAGGGIYPGGHDWQLWNQHLTQMLVLAGRDVAHTHNPSTALPGRRRPRLPSRHGPSKVAPLRSGSTRPGPLRATGRAAAPSLFVVRTTTGTPARMRAPPAATGSSDLAVVSGLVLALVSAAAINVGFLLQHRALGGIDAAADGTLKLVRAAVRRPGWLAGQAIGWAGFALQIVAVALAPLSLVQAFAAGGLALSVPLAAGMFGHRVTRQQVIAVVSIATALAILPIGTSAPHEHLQPPLMIGMSCIVLVGALAIARVRNAAMLAMAAGVFYGAADGAIKAVAVGWGAGGEVGWMVLWVGLAVLGTFGGFVTFQTALRDGGAVTAISLMNALATIAALCFGIVVFGESLGASNLAVIGHLVAVAVVLASVPTLATAQAEMVEDSAAPELGTAEAGMRR